MPIKSLNKPVQVTVRNGENFRFSDHLRNSKYEIGIFLLFHFAFALLIFYCYPYTDIVSDTGSYIRWALDTRYGAPRPGGYSVFLKFLYRFSEQTTIVFITQFIIYCISQLFFFLSSTYLFKITNKYIRASFLGLVMLSFGALYVTNMVITESLFISLTIIMITLCVWFIDRPSIYIYAGIIVALSLLITIRYIALMYPAVIFIAFILALKDKMILTGATFIMLFVVYGYVKKVSTGTERDMGVNVFTAFGGWQKANNALHIVPHISLEKPMINSDDPYIIFTDSMVRATYDNVKNKYPVDNVVCSDFLWLDSLPLRQAVLRKLVQERVHYFYMWNFMGPKYSEFADLMIRKYPAEYARYYLLPNFKRAIFPETEAFEKFQYTGKIDTFGRQWFHIKNDKQAEPRIDILRPILKNLSPFYSFLWLIFAGNIVMCTIILRKKLAAYNSTEMKAGYLFVAFVLLYISASVYAAPVTLRYLLPLKPIIIIHSILYLQIMLEAARKKQLE